MAAERGAEPLEPLIADDDDVVIAAITAAELLVGVELADRRRRRSRESFVESILANVPVEPYDLEVARAHSVLLAHAHRSGGARGAHDLVIAATALTTGRIVLTADPRGFSELPGVVVRAPA